jgi:hypothetical protein
MKSSFTLDSNDICRRNNVLPALKISEICPDALVGFVEHGPHEGHNFKAVAVVAGVKPSTVAWHMQRIYEKLKVHSKSEAVAIALRNGITSSRIPLTSGIAAI